MISYHPNNHPVGSYVLSYASVRADYLRFKKMSDTEFKKHISEVLHYACFICFVKEKRSEHVLCDNGVIHELVHVLCRVKGASLKRARALFDKECELA